MCDKNSVREAESALRLHNTDNAQDNLVQQY